MPELAKIPCAVPYIEIAAAALEEHVKSVRCEDRAERRSVLIGVLRAVCVNPELVQIPQPRGVLDLEAEQFTGRLIRPGSPGIHGARSLADRIMRRPYWRPV
jgi:hypothetical protein